MTSFETEIAIRAYSERPNAEPIASKVSRQRATASPWTLIFDPETTIDAAQRFRFSFYQIRHEEELEGKRRLFPVLEVSR